MKTILIVDDEFLVRIGIRSIMDWEQHGYQILGEAENGQEALKLIETLQPDIVLTDLKMEPVDGLQLMKEAKNLPFCPEFVVLSSYNDFENVKQAMKLGAVDYLFKLSITETELLRVLDEVKIDLSNLPEMNSPENRELLKTQLIRKVIHRDFLSIEKIYEQLQQLEKELFRASDFQGLLIDVDNFFLLHQSEQSGGSLFKFAIQNIVQEVVSEKLSGVVFNYDVAQLFVFIPVDGREKNREILEAVSLIEEYAQRYLGVEISCAISRHFLKIEMLSEIYSELQEQIKNRFWKTEGASALVNAMAVQGVKHSISSMEFLREYLLERDFQRTTEFLKQFFSFLSGGYLDWDESRGKILELYAALCRCKDWGYDIDSFLDSNGLSLYRVVTEYDRLYDMEKSVNQFISSAFEYLNQQGETIKSEILDAKNYVKEHLMQELTVQQMANYVHMNESYFSHLFKKETGQNFSDFVLQQRMEKAILLLKQTNKRIHEVSFEVGIENSNYFSVVFKKVTGKSPQEFRRDFKENERNSS